MDTRCDPIDGLVTLGWGGLIWTGSIDTIWPMFGIANQLLAAIALIVVTTYLFSVGRGRYTWATLIPLAFVTTTTMTAANSLVTGKFWMILSKGLKENNWNMTIQGGLNIAATIFLVASFVVILVYAISQWFSPAKDMEC